MSDRIWAVRRSSTGSGLSRSQASLDPAAVPAIVGEVVRAGGNPLDGPTRSFMEPRFGTDFSQVRVHSDDRAAESARALNAQAYATGQHVVFAHGLYSPSTDAGRRLLAHELTHVVQQRTGAVQQSAAVSQPFDASELEAERVANSVTSEKTPLKEPAAGRPEAEDAGSLAVQRQTAEEAQPAEGEQGIEIDSSELMILPRWQFAELPHKPTLTPATEATPAIQRQDEAVPMSSVCDTPDGMRAVTSGAFWGGKTLDDYYPDLTGAGAWGSNNKAGPFDNGTRAGSAVQFVGTLPIPCDATKVTTVLGQEATVVRARTDGKKMTEGGKPLEGQTFDDIKRSGRDASMPPFRQASVTAVTMADPISGVPYNKLASYEFEVNLKSSLTGTGGSASVGWGVTIEATGGKVTKNEVR